MPKKEQVMTTQAKIAVIYYSSTGNVHKLAQAVAEGAEKAGAEVRLRRVTELAPDVAIAGNPAWAAHVAETHSTVPEATLDDLDWADGVVFGSPTRFGLPASQLKQFIDMSGGLWAQGKLAHKAYSSITSAGNQHGGQESTILAINNTFYHWGGVIVTNGYTNPANFEAGGNPYGVSHASSPVGGVAPGEKTLEVARDLGRKMTVVAGGLRDVRDQL
jgi:NAD(P)H dehydrogenase (quinone)